VGNTKPLKFIVKQLFLVYFLIGILGMVGCISIQKVESGRKRDDNLLFLIEKGKTTAKDIAYSFGPPQKEIVGSTGRVWIYYSSTYKHCAQDGYIYALAENEESSLTLWFDNNGVVKDLNLSYNHYVNPQTSTKEAIKNQQNSTLDNKQ
jgi:outer membrane protein assembly factor BamE (lipoprotein component of BamABCDE complex)